MRKNQGFSGINLMTMLLKELVYMIHIFSVLEKIPIDYFFFQFLKLFLVIFEFKRIISIQRLWPNFQAHKGFGDFIFSTLRL